MPEGSQPGRDSPIVSGDLLLMENSIELNGLEAVCLRCRQPFSAEIPPSQEGMRCVAVSCFRWNGRSDPHAEADYHVVRTDSEISELPALVAARCARHAPGSRPIERLAAAAVHPVDADSLARFNQFLAQPLLTANGDRLTGLDILERIRAAGYDVWVVGGAVRDIVRQTQGTASAAIKPGDLDIAGTVPFNALDSLLRPLVERFELRTRLNKDHTVLFLQRGSEKAILEYAPLKSFFSQLWCCFDHDLSVDVTWRDLHVNCLFYDPFSQSLLDPTGRALSDLRRRSLRPLPVPSVGARPRGHAAITLFRLLRFVARDDFADADLEAAQEFLSLSLSVCCDDLASLESWDKRRIVQKFYGSAKEMDDDCDRRRLQVAADRIDPSLWNTLAALLQ